MANSENLLPELQGQVENLLPMYEAAQRMYSYDNLSGSMILNEDSQRKSQAYFMSQGLGSENALAGAANWGLLSVFMLSRARAKSLFDVHPITSDPFRVLAYFLVGTSVAAYWKFNLAAENARNSQVVQLQHRVASNQQTHTLLNTMAFHLRTRQTPIFVQDPR